MIRGSHKFAPLLAIVVLLAALAGPDAYAQSSPAASAWSEPSTAPTVTESELVEALKERRSRVEAFEFLRRQAEALGVRVWLFGGTAASFAAYVYWDLLREGGDQDYQAHWFDYHYTSIYRSTQDLDIVVDGTLEQVGIIEANLRASYPFLIGDKGAKWEVRSLREPKGKKGTAFFKEALLDDFDFSNQHTDSYSLAMVEITDSPEPVARSLRHWNETSTPFILDLISDQISYYYSDRHSETTRAKAGQNPEILSVIRLLTKAFQYQLSLRPTDLPIIKRVTEDFNPKAISNEVAYSKISRTGKKLIRQAVDIEYAYETLESLGLRKKLAKIGDRKDSSSLAYWMNKEPLRSSPLGSGDKDFNSFGAGQTAENLGLSQQIMSHETNDYYAFESISKAKTGEPNAFISRDGAYGETAAYGNGFYLRIGRDGARGTGLTLRYRLHPLAISGIDFNYIRDQGFVIVRNKEAIRLIPESLTMTLKEYIEFLINGENIDFSDSALWERLKFKIRSSTIIGGDEYLSALAMVRDSWQKSKNIIVLAEWNSLGPAFQKDSESMVDFNEVLNFWNETDDLQEKGRAAEVLLPRTTSVAEYMQLAVELLQELNRSDDKDYKKAIPRFATWFLGHLDDFMKLGPTEDQMHKLGRLFHRIDIHIKLRERFLPNAESAQNFVEIMDHHLRYPSDQFLTQLGELFLRNIDHFVSLNPSADQVREIMKFIRKRDVHIAIRERLLPKTKNVQAFLDLMDHRLTRPTHQFLTELGELFLRNMDHFVSLKPSADQACEITKIIRRRDVHISIRARLLPKTKNVQEFLDLMDHCLKRPTDEFLNEMRELFLRNVDHFVSLKPSADQVRQITKMFEMIDVHIAIRGRLLPKTKNVQEFLKLMDHGVIDPTDQFLSEMQELFLRNVDHFMSLKPSANQVRQITKMLGTIDVFIATADKILPQVKKAREFANYLDHQAIPYRRELMALMSLDKMLSKMTGIPAYPPERFGGINTISETQESLFEKMSDLFLRHLEHFVSLHPTDEDIRNVAEVLQWTEQQLRERMAYSVKQIPKPSSYGNYSCSEILLGGP